MTGEQLRLLIRSGIDSRLSFPGMPEDEWDDVADAVLRAIRAAGIVMGEPVTLVATGEPAQSEGLALVRVVEA